jgi:hypothetical protein
MCFGNFFEKLKSFCIAFEMGALHATLHSVASVALWYFEMGLSVA